MRKMTWILSISLISVLVIGLLSFSCASPATSTPPTTTQPTTTQPSTTPPTSTSSLGGEIKLGVVQSLTGMYAGFGHGWHLWHPSGSG